MTLWHDWQTVSEVQVAQAETACQAAQQAQAMEIANTQGINAVYETALAAKDYPAQVLMHWFINEQVEEEKNAAEILANLELIEERGTAVLMLDKQLGKRSGE